MFKEYPKWIYPVGIKDTYAPGEAPYLVHAEEEEWQSVQEDVKKQERKTLRLKRDAP